MSTLGLPLHVGEAQLMAGLGCRSPLLSSGISYALTNSHSSPVLVSDQRSLLWCWQQLCLVRLAEEGGHVRARMPARSVLFAGRCRRQD